MTSPAEDPTRSVPSGPDPTAFADELLRRCRFPTTRGALSCAVSGGADSLALLVLAVRAGFDVTAIHVDHGLRPGSELEAGFVAGVAERLGARFEARTVGVDAGVSPVPPEDAPGNLEARAREARYAVLPVDVATGHTADDVAETVLLNLIRGSGLDGLAPLVTPGTLCRPLVAIRRAETVELCHQFGLVPLDDPMNADPRFRRVRVRRDVLPLLNDVAERDVVPLLLRLADAVVDDVAVLSRLAGVLDPESAVELAEAPVAVSRRAVRGWLLKNGVGDGHPPSMGTIDRVLAVARGGAARADLVDGWRVSRTRQRLRLDRIDAGKLANRVDRVRRAEPAPTSPEHD